MAQSFENDAKRSELRPLYSLIPFVVLKAIADRFTLGAEKYGKDNWKKGGPEFFSQTKEHLIHHLWAYIEHDESEESSLDNLKAVIWNASALIWWESVGKPKWDKEPSMTLIAVTTPGGKTVLVPERKTP